MNTYYIAGYPVSDELYHHGIKGQKWGIRRYQNEDGTLTAEGRKRYGNALGEHANEHGLMRRLASGDHILGVKRLGERTEKLYDKRAKEESEKGNKVAAKKYEEYRDAQKKANIDREKYISNASTGKLVAQKLLLGPIGSASYQAARERGSTRGEAALAGIADKIPYFGIAASAAVSAYQNKKAYGKVAL